MDIVSRVEVAYGADLTADPATWAWTDITRYVLGQARVTRGRPDFATTTPATFGPLRLNNPDGQFTPSPYSGAFRKNLPIRASLNPGTGLVLRFEGRIADMRLDFPGGPEYCETVINAAGVLRWLRKRKTLRPPLHRAIALSGPIAHWPLEDPSGSFQGASAIPGGTPMVAEAVSFGAVAGPAGTASLPDLVTGHGLLTGLVPTVVATSWRVAFAFQIPDSVTLTPGNLYTVALWGTPGSARPKWLAHLFFDAGTYLSLDVAAMLADGSGGAGVYVRGQYDDGAWHMVVFDAVQTGTRIDFTVTVDGVSAASWQDPLALTPVTSFAANPTWSGYLNNVANVAAAAVWSPIPASSPDLHAAMLAYVGETATDRVTRLFAEEGLPVTVVGSSGVAMGPQRAAKLMDLVDDCAEVDAAIVVDGLGPGPTYISSDARTNVPVSLALDTRRRHVKLPLPPVDDDSRLINDVTASMTSGAGSARYVDEASIASDGTCDLPVTVNVASADQLPGQAAQRVLIGTVAQMRTPAIPINLVDTPDLIVAWLATDISGRATLTGLPEQFPPGGMDLVLEAYVESWDAETWTVGLTCSPFAPWRTFRLAADSGDVSEFVGYLDVDDLELNANIAAGQTTIAVKTVAGSPLSTVADDYPMDLDVEGEQIRVTAAPGGASPQTLSVVRSVNGKIAAHVANTPVSMWAPLTLGS